MDVDHDGLGVVLQVIMEIAFLDPAFAMNVNLGNVLGILGVPASVIHFDLGSVIKHS